MPLGIGCELTSVLNRYQHTIWATAPGNRCPAGHLTWWQVSFFDGSNGRNWINNNASKNINPSAKLKLCWGCCNSMDTMLVFTLPKFGFEYDSLFSVQFSLVYHTLSLGLICWEGCGPFSQIPYSAPADQCQSSCEAMGWHSLSRLRAVVRG